MIRLHILAIACVFAFQAHAGGAVIITEDPEPAHAPRMTSGDKIALGILGAVVLGLILSGGSSNCNSEEQPPTGGC
ncbi:MAG: hypothetical protein ACRCWF_05590 [Beijerinckiaceae bacterium]